MKKETKQAKRDRDNVRMLYWDSAVTLAGVYALAVLRECWGVDTVQRWLDAKLIIVDEQGNARRGRFD